MLKSGAILVPCSEIQIGLVALCESPQGFCKAGSRTAARPGLSEIRLVWMKIAAAGDDKPIAANASAARLNRRKRRTTKDSELLLMSNLPENNVRLWPGRGIRGHSGKHGQPATVEITHRHTALFPLPYDSDVLY